MNSGSVSKEKSKSLKSTKEPSIFPNWISIIQLLACYVLTLADKRNDQMK